MIMQEQIDKLTYIMDELKTQKTVIEKYAYNLRGRIGRRLAYKLLCDEEGAELLKALCSMQQTHGLILSLHPESVYSTEMKVNPETIYNKIIEISWQNKQLIDITLDVYQTLKAETPRFLASEEYCYLKISSPIEGTQWNLELLLLKIISNVESIIAFLDAFISGASELKKGELSRLRIQGMAQADKSLRLPEPPPKTE
jgi:hypothetical protein